MHDLGIAIEEVEDVTESFEAFFEIHQRQLFAAVWLMTRDRHEAEEIAQDAFLRLWERWDRVAQMQDPEGYLYRTAMNLFRSRLRRVAVAVRRGVRSQAPDDELEAVERREALAQALGALTPRERAAVVLTDIVGLTSAEAATALKIRPSTVRVLAARGLERMKEAASDDPST